jgi:hypothetical protein
MESVTTHPLAMKRVRQCEAIGDLRVAVVERCVETGNLRQRRHARPHRSDPGEVDRLMQRRKRHQAIQAVDDLVVDQDGLGEVGPAMRDAVPDGEKLAADRCGAQPARDDAHCGVMP